MFIKFTIIITLYKLYDISGDAANIGISEAEVMLKTFNGFYYPNVSLLENNKIYFNESKINNSICWHKYNYNHHHYITFYLEETSMNTIENAINCKNIIRSLNCNKILLITNDFHMPRAKLIFNHIYKNENIILTCVDAKTSRNLISLQPARLLINRPKDINEWSLFERLEIETKAINNINQNLKKYHLENIPEIDIKESLLLLSKFKQSLLF